MIARPHAHRADPVRLCEFDGARHRHAADNEAHAVVAVQHLERVLAGDPAHLRVGLDDVAGEALHIDRHAQHAVRIDPPQIGEDEALGRVGGVLGAHADPAEQLDEEAPEVVDWKLEILAHRCDPVRVGSGFGRAEWLGADHDRGEDAGAVAAIAPRGSGCRAGSARRRRAEQQFAGVGAGVDLAA